MDNPILNPILAYFQRAGVNVEPVETYEHNPMIDGIDYENIRSPKDYAINPDRRFVRHKKRERGAR